MNGRLAIFAEGLFAKHSGKTAHGVIRYGNREVVAVIDSNCAGRTASDVEPFCLRPVPIVATLDEALELGADTLLIGVAPPGGKLDPAWRPTLLAALEAGLSLEAGLHTQLRADPELREAAARHGGELRDLRVAPPDLTVPVGPQSRPDSVQVVHSVGSDTAIGKKVVTLELDRAARERGLRSVYVPTGQTGVAIAGWGIAVDHVISDYVAGAAERLVHEGAERADLLFVEGQGALFHPAYSGVTLGLLHGSAPDLLVLVHKPNATHNRNYPDLPIPPLNELIAAYERVAAPVRPARVAAIALNTSDLDEEAARSVHSRRRARDRPRCRRRGALRPRARARGRPGRPGHHGEKPGLIFRHRAVRKSPASGDLLKAWSRAATRSSRTTRSRRSPRRPTPGRRRYSLARVAPSSRSALGVDRLERMEEIAAELRDGKPQPAGRGLTWPDRQQQALALARGPHEPLTDSEAIRRALDWQAFHHPRRLAGRSRSPAAPWRSSPRSRRTRSAPRAGFRHAHPRLHAGGIGITRPQAIGRARRHPQLAAYPARTRCRAACRRSGPCGRSDRRCRIELDDLVVPAHGDPDGVGCRRELNRPFPTATLASRCRRVQTRDGTVAAIHYPG